MKSKCSRFPNSQFFAKEKHRRRYDKESTFYDAPKLHTISQPTTHSNTMSILKLYNIERMFVNSLLFIQTTSLIVFILYLV